MELQNAKGRHRKTVISFCRSFGKLDAMAPSFASMVYGAAARKDGSLVMSNSPLMNGAKSLGHFRTSGGWILV